MDDYGDFESFNAPIVIDNGSGVIKAGIAGRERPSAVVPACVGKAKHRRVMLQAERKDTYFFNDFEMQNAGLCRLIYPQKNGVIHDMERMTELWQHVYKELINSPMEDHPVLLTEAVNNPISNRISVGQIFFEQLGVPALYFAPPPVLSLYASGRLTGCVLDCGHGLSSVVPICEGFAIPHAIQRLDVGGDEISEYFSHLLSKSGHQLNSTSSEMETVRKIKEKECELRVEAMKAMDSKKNDMGNDDSFALDEYDDSFSNSKKYVLPDGTQLNIGLARYRAPEILFNPSIIGMERGGIQDCVLKCINKCDLDLRKDLFKTIVLSGGSTNIKNFGRRLVTELQSNVPRAKIKVYAPLERHLTTWIGGSLLSFLEGFRTMWISKKEYNDIGNSVLFRKSFF